LTKDKTKIPAANVSANVPTFQHTTNNKKQITNNQYYNHSWILLEHSFIVGTRWNTLEQIFQKNA
jgi:hypothetical protein